MHEHKRRRRCGLATAIIVAWMGGATSTPATTLAPADFEEMVSSSQVIVRGRVERVEALLNGPRRAIERVVTLAVLDDLKGDAASTVVFRVPGGQVGRYRRVMVGAPDFTQGDEVIVFLKGRSPVVPMPFGLSQGVYRVHAGAHGREVMPFAPEPGRVVRGEASRRFPGVDEFAQSVRRLAGGR
jgi:hypothetical protein